MTPLVSAFMSIWPLVTISLFIGAILLSYRIEKRSPDLVNRTGFPRWAMMLHTITNLNVARDGRTQSMRRTMLLLLGGVVLMFILVAFAVSTIERTD
ncbi:hypothetical protein [Mesorhizobium sp. CAU 1741]|uniref:hypothetical protein n=1 Tax=Mesorhizobium sp. CAU 1741 TaxID=3140366 RepID=UPI00325B5C1E